MDLVSIFKAAALLFSTFHCCFANVSENPKLILSLGLDDWVRVYNANPDGSFDGNFSKISTVKAVSPDAPFPQAFDYDYESKKIYIEDGLKKHRVISLAMDGSAASAVVDEPNMWTASSGIAVDWVHKHLYRADKYQKVIAVSKLDGTDRKTIVSNFVYWPMALVVDPRNGWIYWSDSNRGVSKCRMNGKTSSRQKIIKGVKVTALAIDYTSDELFFIVKGQIMSSDLKGNNLKMVLHAELVLSQAFSLAILGHFIYWPDQASRSVYRARKDSSDNKFENLQLAGSGIPLNNLNDIKIYHKDNQPKVADSPCAGGGGCSHLCLLGPDRQPDCACPDGYVKVNDTNCEPGLTARLYGTNVPELYYGNKSGYICEDAWSREDADVVCHMMGYKNSYLLRNGIELKYLALKTYLLDDLLCNGSETNLMDCRFGHSGGKLGKASCGPRQVAGTECDDALP